MDISEFKYHLKLEFDIKTNVSTIETILDYFTKNLKHAFNEITDKTNIEVKPTLTIINGKEQKTLGQYLKVNLEHNIIDYAIRANTKSNGDITFYIHANGHDSDTLDFVVDGNSLMQDPDIIKS